MVCHNLSVPQPAAGLIGLFSPCIKAANGIDRLTAKQHGSRHQVGCAADSKEQKDAECTGSH